MIHFRRNCWKSLKRGARRAKLVNFAADPSTVTSAATSVALPYGATGDRVGPEAVSGWLLRGFAVEITTILTTRQDYSLYLIDIATLTAASPSANNLESPLPAG